MGSSQKFLLRIPSRTVQTGLEEARISLRWRISSSSKSPLSGSTPISSGVSGIKNQLIRPITMEKMPNTRVPSPHPPFPISQLSRFRATRAAREAPQVAQP